MKFAIRCIKAKSATFALALLPAGAALAAPTISLSGPATVQLGSSFSVNVVASDFTDLYGYQFDLSFTPAVFQATGASEGSFLKAAGTTFFDGGSVNNASGIRSFMFDTLLGAGPGASGSGVLATLTFNTVGGFRSVGTFALSNVRALNSSLNDIGVSVGTLSVTAVPEPTAVGMMLAGLGAMAVLGHRRRKCPVKDLQVAGT